MQEKLSRNFEVLLIFKFYQTQFFSQNAILILQLRLLNSVFSINLYEYAILAYESRISESW